MNRWEDTVLTDKGAAFHSKLANGQTLKITRVMTGAAKVPMVNLRQQTGVTDEGSGLKKVTSFSPLSPVGSGKASFRQWRKSIAGGTFF